MKFVVFMFAVLTFLAIIRLQHDVDCLKTEIRNQKVWNEALVDALNTPRHTVREP